MKAYNYQIWKLPDIVKNYLSGSRLAFPGAVQQIEQMLKLINYNSSAVNSFLDLGCGDGLLGASVLEKYPGSRGVFLDFSGEMLSSAKERMKQFNKRIKLINYDYSNPEWTVKVNPYAPFDVIITGYSIHHQPDIRKKGIYSEIYGLLRSGGIFLNIEHVKAGSVWIERVHNENFIDALYEYQKNAGPPKTRDEISNDFYTRGDKQANILTPVETQCGWLRDIGFKDVDCYFKIFEMSLFGGRK